MKHLMILFFFLPLIIFANDNIILDDVIIEGKASTKIDSIKRPLDTNQYLTLPNKKAFKYKFQPALSILKAPIKINNDKFAYKFSLSTKFNSNFNFIYDKNLYGGLNILTLNNYHKIMLNVGYDFIQNGYLNTKNTLVFIDKAKFNGFITQFSYKNLEDVNTNIFGFWLNIEKENNSSFLKTHKFIFTPHYISQDANKNSSNIYFDFSYKTKFIILQNHEINTKAGFNHNSPLFEGSAFLMKNDFGLFKGWLSYSNGLLLPSLFYRYQFDYQNFIFNFTQIPFVENTSTPNILIENNFLKITSKNKLLTSAINPKFTIRYIDFFELLFTYNFQYVNNEKIYWQPTKSSLYEIDYADTKKSIFKINLFKTFNEIDFINEFTYTIANPEGNLDFIPFLPEISNNFKAIYRLTPDINITPSISYLYNRKDYTKKTLDDCILLNLYGEWSFDKQKNNAFFLNIENILNQKYQKYTNTPTERFNIEIGVKWNF